MKKSNLIFKIILGILFFCLIILVLYLYDRKSENSGNLGNKISDVVSNQDENKPNIEKKVEIEVEEQSTWNDGDVKFYNYQIIIKNNLDTNIENWKIILHMTQNTNIVKFWNGNWDCIENNIIIRNVDYNSIIESKSEISLGGIFSSLEDFEIESYEIYSNEEKLETIDSTNNDNKLNEVENEDEMKNEYNNNDIEKDSPVKIHGKLSVQGKNIVDENGEMFLMQGISTHSISAFSQYINYEAFKYLRDELNVNTIRLALYSDINSGYKKELHQKVDEGIKYATELGLYVVLDWHILEDNNPNINKEFAKEFFVEMSSKYKDYENVLYEICNEPNGDVTWDVVKSYSEEVISLIRQIDNDGIIIVGTPNYCQELNAPINNPIENYENLLYSFHFYAGTHGEKLRDTLSNACDKNLPIIVSEFGISEASGDGNVNEEEANKWIDFLREKKIGYICWNLSNKNESSAILKSDTNSISNWSDDELSQTGLWIKNKYNN